jgi:voltage-gated potassium channel
MFSRKKNSEYVLLPFEILMVGVSFYSIVVVIIQLSLPPKSEMRALFSYFDNLACLIFAMGFFNHLFREPHRWRYLFTWGIVDIASAIPMFPLLRLLRLIRIFRLTGIIRHPNVFNDAIQKAPSASLLYLMFLVLVTIYTAACAGILYFESQIPNSNIKTGADSLWFGLVTISTVGYGNLFPYTMGARICSAFLMLTGISVFASLAGFLLEPLRRLAKGGIRVTSTQDLANQIAELQMMLQDHLAKRAEEIQQSMEEESSNQLDQPEDSTESEN